LVEIGADFILIYVHCRTSPHSRCFILFSPRSSGYQLSCKVAAVSAKWPVEHVNNALQNIANEETPHIVLYTKKVSDFWQALLFCSGEKLSYYLALVKEGGGQSKREPKREFKTRRSLSLSPTSLRPLCCIVDRGCGLPCESTSKTNRLNRGTEILSSSAARAGSEQNKVSQRDSPSIHKHPTGTPCRDRNVKMQYKERTQVP